MYLKIKFILISGLLGICLGAPVKRDHRVSFPIENYLPTPQEQFDRKLDDFPALKELIKCVKRHRYEDKVFKPFSLPVGISESQDSCQLERKSLIEEARENGMVDINGLLDSPLFEGELTPFSQDEIDALNRDLNPVSEYQLHRLEFVETKQLAQLVVDFYDRYEFDLPQRKRKEMKTWNKERLVQELKKMMDPAGVWYNSIEQMVRDALKIVSLSKINLY